MRKVIRTVSLFAAVAVAAVMGYVSYLQGVIPDQFYMREAEEFSLEQLPSVQAAEPQRRESAVGVSTVRSREIPLKILGVIPVKDVSVQQVKERHVVPCGTPFGLKMLTEGVIVVGLNPVESARGTAYPARDAGLRKGDIILEAGGSAVSSNRELTRRIREAGGRSVVLKVRRGGAEIQVSITPVKSVSDGEYRCGIWVRDSSAGIGTVTFYDPASGTFGGLGHAVCDVDTGEMMPLSSGEVVPVHINGVEKGRPGTPGELKGSFLSSFSCGTLKRNDNTGIYGTLERSPVSDAVPIPVCYRQEVREGAAEILTTVAGTHPRRYQITIERADLNGKTPTKNMVIRITDPELLKQTGGIVQGMSGSPILQNGKLVGAVTHVLVNDPTRGYGIFIENMLEAAG